MLLAAALVGGSTHGAEQPAAPTVFQSRPQVEPLRCPSQGSGVSTAKPAAPDDRVPAADEIDAAAIDPGPMLSARPGPRLPGDVVRRFNLPAAGEGRLRVGIWGDSHVAAGFITEELSKHVEAKGLTVHTRFIPASAGRAGVRLPLRQVCKGGWQSQPSYNAPAPISVGPSLLNLQSTKTGDYLWLDFRRGGDRRVRGVRIHYLPTRATSAIGVRIDDGAEVRFVLSQPRGASGTIDIAATSSIATLKMRVLKGEMVFQGLTLDHASPADVTIDVFGLPSATVNSWANANVAYLRNAFEPGNYDAVILEYGTNEGAIGRFDAASYAAMLRASLRNLRMVLPDAACVLMGPTDRGVRIPNGARRGRVDLLHYSRVHQQITRLQSEVGEQFGCALWDWQGLMGGAGSIYAWARATPALAAPDLIHLTPAGYRRSAGALAQSLGWAGPRPVID